MDKILRCPICNKKPKLKFDRIPTGVFVKIICKPLLRKPHFEVEQGQAGAVCERATVNAIKDWNKKVVAYMLDVK